MFLWEDECKMTIYVQNRFPHRILENKNQEEAFLGVKP
jgi:hypothetical protein